LVPFYFNQGINLLESKITNQAIASADSVPEQPVTSPTSTEALVAIVNAFSAWASESLSPVAFGFTWLYLLFGFAHRFTLPPPINGVMSATAFGTALVLIGLRIWWQRNPAKGEWAHAGSALIAVLIGLNSGMHLFLTGDVLQSSNLLLLVVGIGFFFLSSAWLFGALATIYLCWGIAILTIKADGGIWVHFTFGLISATALSVLAHLARKRALRRVVILRVQDTQRTKQLQDALTMEQASEKALRESEARYRSLYTEVEQRAQELHAANTQLAQAVRMKDEFLASISHELRTPLTAVLGLTESLQEDLYGPLTDLQQGVLRNINQSGRHLLALITDILDVAKIEAGQFRLDFGPAAVDSVCQASLMLIKQKAEQKKLSVAMNFDSAVKMIETDDRRLKQILVNLLDNAIKFTPESGAIGLEVKGDADNKTVHFSVWDTGIGIASADFARLFKPFVQLDSRLSRQYAGSGLGLVLVYRMVEMQGGSVTVDSDVACGSRFTISLPWRIPLIGAAPALVVPPATPPSADLPLVLIADDHELVTTTLSTMLMKQGIQTVVVQNGADALEKAALLHPAFLLIDMQLPTMEGTAILTALRNEAHLQTTPIIAIPQ